MRDRNGSEQDLMRQQIGRSRERDGGRGESSGGGSGARVAVVTCVRGRSLAGPRPRFLTAPIRSAPAAPVGRLMASRPGRRTRVNLGHPLVAAARRIARSISHSCTGCEAPAGAAATERGRVWLCASAQASKAQARTRTSTSSPPPRRLASCLTRTTACATRSNATRGSSTPRSRRSRMPSPRRSGSPTERHDPLR